MRRVARVLGGIIWLGAAVLVVAGLATVGWMLAGLIAAMVLLDATADFCVLCFLVTQVRR